MATDSDEDDEEHPNIVGSFLHVQSQWAFEGAETIDQILDCLLDNVEYYRRMKRDGWKLAGRIFNGTGYLQQDAP